MRLSVFALDGVFDSGLSVLLDTFSVANDLAVAEGMERLLLTVEVVGVRQQVRTALGLTASVEAIDGAKRPDWVAVPALNTREPERLEQALARADVREAIGYLRDCHAAGAGLASACLGTFIIAETGLLDGADATTSWPMAPLFRKRYPKIRLDDSQMITVSGRLVTAGAMMGHLDLALFLVAQASPEIASLTARFMLVDRRSSQARYVVPSYLSQTDPLVDRFERFARANLAGGFSLQAAAKALGVGPRTLQRRTEAVLGKSPLAFVQDLRVARAQHLVSIGLDLEAVAGEVGYADAATLRALLRRHLGRGVRELRAELQA
ncbi:GlxA family transcriptional regulator [Ensifer sp.]|jgi:transcriptional regulator GlxA family with amidase domain|uniref:GlxA family transcriptional regulator n=1 Tax=Ensifer sp. TaxID=1872086 RepID=UPI002E14B694|nr:helix-turn-helix domain-containing protein [Ensifer sp.]